MDTSITKACAYHKCTKGEDKTPRVFKPRNEWHIYCSPSCRVLAFRLEQEEDRQRVQAEKDRKVTEALRSAMELVGGSPKTTP